MGVLNFILNLAGLGLWLSWRATGLSESAHPPVLSLASTLKRAEPLPARRWPPLAGLLLLVLLRSVFYWQVGPALGWVPRLDLGAATLLFPTTRFSRVLCFSVMSFLAFLLVYYVWLILLAMVNRSLRKTNPVHTIISLQLGWVARWAASLQFLLILVGVMLLWWVTRLLLAWLGLVTPASGGPRAWQQGLALALSSCLTWKYPILVCLAVYTANAYVYVGKSELWNYATLTGRHLLRPLRWLPLNIGKVDLKPLVAIALLLVLSHYAALGLAGLFQQPIL